MEPTVLPLDEQTAASLRYLDDLRKAPRVSDSEWIVEEDSQVIQVSVNGNESETMNLRLCHLTSMLPSTSDDQGSLQPDYGLYTEGAGLLALLHFNQRDTTIVRDLSRLRNCNVQFTMSFGNTQFSPIEACRVLAQEVMPLDRQHSLRDPHPISLVGATRSAVTAPLATLASVYQLPIISYGSTSSQLNQRDSYPFFGRTVPTNQGDAVAAVSYMRHVLSVTHMGVLFVKDPFGSAFHKEVLQAGKNTLDPPMQIISSAYYPSDGEEGMERALQLLHESGYKFFYGIISTPTYNTVMRQAYKMGMAGHPGITWILSGSSGQLLGEEYSYDAATQGDLAAATSGIGVISLNMEDNPAFAEAWSLLEGNQAIKEYFIDKHDPALNFSQFQFYDTPTYWEYLQYDAIMSLGFAACEASNEFFSGPQLFESMMNTLFRGASGQVEFDATTGTRSLKSLSYKITNVVARSPDKDGTIYFDTADTMRQEPTLNNTWIHIPESQAYVYADGTTNPPPGLPPLTVDMHLIGTPILVTGLFLGAVCILLSLLCATWTYFRRTTQVVRVSQPFFLLLICGGTFLMAWSIIFMSFQEPMPQGVMDAGCMAVIWTFSSGFVVAFSALLSKTLRIYRLLQRGRSFRRVVVNVQDVLRPFLGLAALNVTILTAWNILSPLRWTRIEMNSFDEFARATSSYGTCQSDNQTLQWVFAGCLVGVDLMALVSANIVNYKARQIASELHEASSIAISMVILLEAALIGAPAVLAVKNNPPASFLIRSVVVSIVCCAILLPIFLPKLQAGNSNKRNHTESKNRGGGGRNQAMSQLVGGSKMRPSSVAAIRSQAMFSQIEGSDAISKLPDPSSNTFMASSGFATGTCAMERNSASLYILPEGSRDDSEKDEVVGNENDYTFDDEEDSGMHFM